MLVVTAIEPTMCNHVVSGYVLEDESGHRTEASISSIMSVIKNNKAIITNLYVDKENKLRFGMSQSEYLQKSKDEQHKEVTEKISESKIVEEPVKAVEKKNVTHVSVKLEAPKSDDNSKIGRMKNLVNKLNHARMVYEQGTDEVMSNFEYDKLYDELQALEEELGVILSNSPTVNVGYEVVSDLPKAKHTHPMLSLAKTKSREDLKSFLGNKKGVLSWKMDGLTVVLTYKNGELTSDSGVLTDAVTRGDGETGEVITPNAFHFKNIPHKINYKGTLVIRGEAVIRYSTFNKINETMPIDAKYKNPRNLCSGSVRQLDSKIAASRNIEWYGFDIDTDGANMLSNNVSEQFEQVKELGFDTVEYKVVTAETLDDAIDWFESKFSESGKGFDIPTDGLVLTFEDKQYGLSLGRTAKAPKHSIAFKWKDDTATTNLTDIEWQVGRTGIITPVAIFEPVDIEGSTIQRASVHNLSIFAGLELGYGDEIEVYKANMIIPQISANNTRSGSCGIPAQCPCCGEETEVREDPDSGVYTLWCNNPYCSAQSMNLFKHFVSRDAMNIDGISKATLNVLIENGIVTDLPSIYHIAEHRDEICSLDGFGTTSFNNMVMAIDKSRNVKVANLIYALGIPNVGLATAKLICKAYNNDLGEIVSAEYGDLTNIEGVGDVIEESFIEYFNDVDNLDQFTRLVKELNIVHEEISTDTSMAGVTICVTGDVYIFPNRRAIKDTVENMGGKLTGSVSRSTNYLVTNDTTSGSRKNKAAQEYGIPILTEQEFIDKFNIQV